MASESTIARLKFDMTCNSSGLRAGMAQAAQIVQTGMGRIGASLKAGGGFSGLGSIAGKFGFSMPGEFSGMMGGLGGMASGPMGMLGAAGGFYATMQAFASKAKEIQHTSARMNVNTDQYLELERAARKSGSSIDEVSGGMLRMQRSIFQANSGNKQLSNTYKMLGVDTQRLMGMNAGRQLEEVAKGLATIGNETMRRGVESQIFGRGGAAMDPLMQHLSKKGGLNAFHKWWDPNKQDLESLADMKFNVIPEAENFGMKVASYATDMFPLLQFFGGKPRLMKQAMPNMFTKGVNGALGGDNDAAAAEAAYQPPRDTSLRALGQLAMAGTQDAYAATVAWKYDISDKQEEQTDLLRRIADNTDDAGRD
jgi:hypothetical protein